MYRFCKDVCFQFSGDYALEQNFQSYDPGEFLVGEFTFRLYVAREKLISFTWDIEETKKKQTSGNIKKNNTNNKNSS